MTIELAPMSFVLFGLAGLTAFWPQVRGMTGAARRGLSRLWGALPRPSSSAGVSREQAVAGLMSAIEYLRAAGKLDEAKHLADDLAAILLSDPKAESAA